MCLILRFLEMVGFEGIKGMVNRVDFVLVADMGVDHGCVNLVMPHQLADGAYIHALLMQERGVGMPQCVEIVKVPWLSIGAIAVFVGHIASHLTKASFFQGFYVLSKHLF